MPRIPKQREARCWDEQPDRTDAEKKLLTKEEKDDIRPDLEVIGPEAVRLLDEHNWLCVELEEAYAGLREINEEMHVLKLRADSVERAAWSGRSDNPNLSMGMK